MRKGIIVKTVVLFLIGFRKQILIGNKNFAFV